MSLGLNPWKIDDSDRKGIRPEFTLKLQVSALTSEGADSMTPWDK